MKTKSKRRAGAVAGIAILTAALSVGCGSLPEPQSPEARAFVTTEIASLPSDGSYSFTVLDFSDSSQTSRGITSGDATFLSLSRSIGFEEGRRIVGNSAPPSGRFLGSPRYLRLSGAGTMSLGSPSTVLGLHVVLPSRAAVEHRWIRSGTEARLTITGTNRGAASGTIKSIIAFSDGEITNVTDRWTWVDLSELGTVTDLEFTFESPLDDLPTLLMDNVTISTDFAADQDYFTIALLPNVSEYVHTPEILESQLSYLDALSRSGELVYVSHVGGLVLDPESDDEWAVVSELLGPFLRSVPSGIVTGPGDYVEDGDPSLGVERYIESFDIPGAFRRSGPEFSPDGHSSYLVFDTPIGEVLSLHIAVDAPGDTVQWARDTIHNHPGLPVMVTTARYLEAAAGQLRRYPDAALSGDEETWEPRSPQMLWEDLVWRNQAIFLVASGDGSSEAVRTSRNRGEHQVVEMLVSYNTRVDGGEGYLRLLRIYPGRNELRALTYSPYLDMYEQDVDSSFVVPLDISGRLGID